MNGQKDHPFQAHYVLVFGLVCGLFELSWHRCLGLFVHLLLRQVTAAAVRLNLIGPFRSVSLMMELMDYAEGLVMDQASLERSRNASTTSKNLSFQSYPLGELIQSLHPRLYSRLFQS